MTVFSKNLIFILLLFLGSFFLWGCGGGESQSSLSKPIGPIVSFVPDSLGSNSANDLLSLTLNSEESGEGIVVLNLMGTGLDTTASGVSGNLIFGTALLTFVGFEIVSEQVGVGVAAPQETAQDTLVVGLYDLKASDGILGKFTFKISPQATGQSASLAFLSLVYIDQGSNLLPSPILTGLGGEVQTD